MRAETAPLTVAQILPALDAGGVERGTVEIAEALVGAGHRSIVVSGGGRLVPRLEAGGTEHVAMPVGRKSPLTLRLVPRLRRLIVERDVDVVHARSRMPAWIAWHAWRRLPRGGDSAQARFVTTVHGLYSVSRYSSVMVRGERVVVGSQTTRDYVLASYPEVDPGRLVLIPRGVDRASFPAGYRPDAAWLEAWRSEHPQLPGRAVLALVGRITRLKGHLELVALMRRLTDLPVHALVVGGDDAGRRRYVREVRRAATGLPITFTGHRDDVREILAACDLVLSLSSKPESFGRAALEALSLGVPVVGYDHGGVGEILAALYPSGQVPPGDLDALEARVRATLTAPAPVPAEHPFTLERMLERTLATYAGLAEERAGRAQAG